MDGTSRAQGARPRRPMSKGVKWLALIAILSLVVAACGDGGSEGSDTTSGNEGATTSTEGAPSSSEGTTGGGDVSAEVQAAADEAESLGLQFAMSHDEILEKAQQEDGTLVVQTSTEDFQAFKDAFEAEYPFITLEWVELSGAATERMLIEVESGQASRYDVGYPAPEAYNNISDLMAWDLYGMASVGVLDMPLESIDEQNHLVVAAGHSGVALAYNSDLIAEGDLPQTWDEIADPRFARSELGMTLDIDLNNVSVLATSPDWGIDRVVDLMSSMAELEPIYTDGHANAVALVQSGEVAISPFVNLHTAIRSIDEDPDGPLQIHFVEPVPIRASEAYGVFGDELAQAPYSALLFVEWISGSDAAQELLDADPLQASLFWDGSRMAEMIGDLETTVADPAAVAALPDWILQIQEAAGFPTLEQ